MFLGLIKPFCKHRLEFTHRNNFAQLNFFNYLFKIRCNLENAINNGYTFLLFHDLESYLIRLINALGFILVSQMSTR